MKVDGPGSTRAASSSKKASKARKTGGADFAKALKGPVTEEASTGSVSASGSAGAIDALLALQEVDDTDGDRERGDNARGQAWGEDMLAHLENIRTGLLTGGIPASHLQQLAESVAKNRMTVSDPRLSGILNEIEVRARVELAKYRQ